MGYDISQFVDGKRISRNLICSVCTDVLCDPIQIDRCEHVYCRDCLDRWLALRSMCPQDQSDITRANIKPAPRILRNLIQELEIKCKFASKGCQLTTTVERLEAHVQVCKFNDVFLWCGQCNAKIKPFEKVGHNCVNYLLSEVAKLKIGGEAGGDLKKRLEVAEAKVKELEAERKRNRELISDLKTEVAYLNSLLKSGGVDVGKVYKK